LTTVKPESVVNHATGPSALNLFQVRNQSTFAFETAPSVLQDQKRQSIQQIKEMNDTKRIRSSKPRTSCHTQNNMIERLISKKEGLSTSPSMQLRNKLNPKLK